MGRELAFSQPQRLLSLAIDSAVVVAACWLLFGTFYPPVGDKGFWAYSALLAVLVGSKLVTPYYVKPVDAISYAVPAFVSLMLINQWTAWGTNERWWFGLAAGFAGLVVLLALANIVANSLRFDWAKVASNQIRLALEIIGRPSFVYTPLLLFAVFSFHRETWLEAVVILIVAGFIVARSLGDFLFQLFLRFRSTLSNRQIAGRAGTVVAYQDPGIVLLRQEFEDDIKRYDILFINDRHGPKKLGVALDFVGRFEGILVRTVEIGRLTATSLSLVGTAPETEAAYHLSPESLRKVCSSQHIDSDTQKNIVGLVGPDTSISRLYFEVVENRDLAAGRLVSSVSGNKKILYQIVAGMTKEESVSQKNTFGYVRGQAQQIGI